VIDSYIADGGVPLWATSVWLALKFIAVWLALRLPPLRAFLAVLAMVVASTIVLVAWEIILPTSLPLLALLVLGVVVETAVEAAVLVLGFRVAWSRRFGLLLLANVLAVVLSVATAMSSDFDRASSAYVIPATATRADVIRAAGGPDLERSVDSQGIACSDGGVRALEYHAPTGTVARLLPLTDRWPGSPRTVVTVCLDENDRVVKTDLIEFN
jgi:hypothetical protein